MAKNIKGITIEIGGNTQPLNKALDGVNKKSRDLQGELRQVDRLLKLDPSNTTLLEQKQKLLAESISNTKSKLDTLKEAERQAQQQFEQGKIGEEQYRALQREIVGTEQALQRLEDQSKEFGSVLSQKLKAMGDGMQEFGGKVEGVGKKLLPATAVISGAGAAAFKLAADLEDASGATDQIFKDSANTMREWADHLKGYYGIAKGEALEYGNMMGTMLQEIGGLTEEEAAKQAQTLIELAGDLTAMYGGTTADAVRALTGALKGNNTMLDNYGMAANDAMVKSKALEMGLISEGEQMDLASKQAATLALIMEQSGAAQGQAARESEGASGTMRTFTTETKNLAAAFGDFLLPIITPLIQKISEFIQWLNSLDDTTKKIIVVVSLVVAAVGPLLIIIGKVITAVGTITPMLPILGKAFTALTGPVGLAVAAVAGLIAIGVTLYKNWDTIKEKAGQLRDKIANLFKGISWKLPDIKLPHFSISGNFSLNPPSIPKIGVDWYDKGGIFNSPQIIGVGERRPEFVGALDDLRKIFREESSIGQASTTAGPLLNVEHLTIANDMDVQELAVKLGFYYNQVSRATGGA